ncbi:hypothetical protein [Aeromonas hydrophila]|uniref:hypothetical protein n=1 Tax=Aeromonas hydrophila TaxID=644 RepID=UPI000D0D2E1E|nr:hypothetical protein [Aeromonas hydrophila]AVP84320.1 hypothetical protein C7K70_09775 [Aeromonas hydrophila]
MTLMLKKLACAILDPKVQTQAYLSKMPADGVSILVCQEHTIYLQCVKQGDRLFAISTDLTSDIDEQHLKVYAMPPYRSEHGNAGIFVTNMNSKDRYSSAKRSVIRAERGTYSIKRTEDAYVFTATSKQIEPVSLEVFDHLLELFFEDSLITSKDHPVYQSLVSKEKDKHTDTAPAKETQVIAATTLISEYAELDIDLSDIDTINI